jgi:hypothetical protein
LDPLTAAPYQYHLCGTFSWRPYGSSSSAYQVVSVLNSYGQAFIA